MSRNPFQFGITTSQIYTVYMLACFSEFPYYLLRNSQQKFILGNMKCKSPFNFQLSKWTQGAFYQTVYTEFLKRVPSALDAVGVDGHQREAVKGEPGEGGWQNADSSNSVWQIFLFNFIK